VPPSNSTVRPLPDGTCRPTTGACRIDATHIMHMHREAPEAVATPVAGFVRGLPG